MLVLFVVLAIFYGAPMFALTFFCVSVSLYVDAKKKNKLVPDTYSVREIKKRKIWLIVSSVIEGVFLTAFLGIIVLVAMGSISFM